MIAIPIVASTVKEALKDIRKSNADLVELRLDFIKDINTSRLEKLLRTNRKAIVTDRKKRHELIKKAIELKAGFIDLDISLGEKSIKNIIKEKQNTRIIVSFHNFKKTDRKEINARYSQIKKLNPDIIKIVTYANSIEDNLIILGLIKKAKKQKIKIIALCMGEKGQISRILSVPFGAFLTFGSLEKGKESAPGQIQAKALKEIYHVNELKNPKIFGLLGNPVSHSKGYIFHNRKFKNSEKIYVNFLVNDISSFIRKFKPIISGLSITIPFKRKVIRLLDKVGPLAKKIGAVNTVIKKKNKLIGYNTDITGAIKAISSKTRIKGKNVLLLGAGGVARAIAYGIVNEGGNLIIINRTEKKAKNLSKELNCSSAALKELPKLSYIDIIINATSIGMEPNIENTPIKKKILRKISKKNALVFDSVYTPKTTKLLKQAEKLGFITVSGYDMFINQAEEQARLFLEV